MEFFNQAIDILKILVMALGAGLAVWGVINLLEGYGSDNPAANAHVRDVYKRQHRLLPQKSRRRFPFPRSRKKRRNRR